MDIKKLNDDYQVKYENLERGLRSKEKDLNDQISAVDKRGKMAVRQVENEKDAALENTRNRAIREVSDTEQAHQVKLRRIQTEGDLERERVKAYHEHEYRSADAQGRRKIKDVQTISAQQFEREAKEGQFQQERLKNDTKAVITALRAQGIDKMKEEELAAREQVRLTKEVGIGRSEQLKEKFSQNHADLYKQQTAILGELGSRTQKTLDKIRDSYDMNLNLYATQKEDPFYRVVSVSSQLQELEDGFHLRIQVPAHERENIQCKIQGREAIVSGTRRSEDHQDGMYGVRETATYQSFSEKFYLPYPVDGRGLRRVEDGQDIVFVIPKQTSGSTPKTKTQGAEPAREVNRPDFPFRNAEISRKLV